VVETGTRHGGSALYFADLLAARRKPGMVISVDVDHASLQIGATDHPRLVLIKRRQRRPGEHRRSQETPVVEDTCINGHPVKPDFGPGPMEAINQFVAAHPGLLSADVEREDKFGCTFAPKGHFVRL
jgi:cephalosporin hydroxylase